MGKQGYVKIFNEDDWVQINPENIDIIDDCRLELRQKKKALKTISQYYNDWRIVLIYILKNCDNKCILDLKKSDFRNFSLWIQEHGSSASRHNRQMSSLRTLLNYCEEESEYEYSLNVANKVKGLPKESVRKIIFLSNSQVIGLVDKLILLEQYQYATILALAYDSVGRKNEIFQVKKESFYDEKQNTTNIVIGKRGKKFPLLYFSLTKKCAKLYLEQRGEDEIEDMWIQNTGSEKQPVSRVDMIYDWFKYMSRLLSEMEDKEIDFNVHSLRHSGIENLSTGTHYVCKELGYEEGVPIDDIKLLCNHTSIETTIGYLKDKSSERLQEVFKVNVQD